MILFVMSFVLLPSCKHVIVQCITIVTTATTLLTYLKWPCQIKICITCKSTCAAHNTVPTRNCVVIRSEDTRRAWM
jgi:hypothetical protein